MSAEENKVTFGPVGEIGEPGLPGSPQTYHFEYDRPLVKSATPKVQNKTKVKAKRRKAILKKHR